MDFSPASFPCHPLSNPWNHRLNQDNFRRHHPSKHQKSRLSNGRVLAKKYHYKEEYPNDA
jgi:hypothetical protein